MVEALRIAGAAALLAVVCSGCTHLAGQTKTTAAPFDLTGIWMNDNTLDERLKREGRKRQTAADLAGPPEAAAPPPLTPKYKEIYDQRRAAEAKYAEGVEPCDWPGMPQIMTYPYPFEVLSSPGRLTLIFEAESQVRRIFLDRKEHLPPDDLDPTYNGDSIGRWEGSTLVIDTIGFNTRRTVRGLPHSDAMHIVERITPANKNTINDEMTITDPEAFTRPIIMKVTYSRRPDWRIREYTCLENNRDMPDASGERAGGIVK
jgi:hypothetical protein